MIGDKLLFTEKSKKNAKNVLDKINNEKIILIYGPSGSQKCLGKGTKILMYDGSLKRVENITVGDKVMSPASTASTVLSTSSFADELYKVKQKNGNDYIVNKNHILTLLKYNVTTKELPKQNGKRRRKHIRLDDTIIDISVQEYLKKYGNSKNPEVKGFKVPVFFKIKDIKLEPYFLGVWLGDGRNNGDSITNPEPEIEKYLRYYAEKLNMKLVSYKYKKDDCPCWAITHGKHRKFHQTNYIKDNLRLYNLINNKHIPDVYKINSRKNRLELLAGLLDTDGSYDGNGYNITSKYEKLADDIVFLARSLGFRVSKSIVKVKKYPDNEYYTVFIYGHLNEIPCKVKRKIGRIRKINKHPLKCGIKLEYIGEGECFGFELDSKDKRFLLEDFTVTHNSETAECLQELLYNEDKQSVVISMDDFYLTHPTVRNENRKKLGIESVGLSEIDFEFLHRICDDFKNKKPIHIQRTHKYADIVEHLTLQTEKIDVLIVEGIFSGYLKKDNYGDYAVFLEGNPSQTLKFRTERGKENPKDKFREEIVQREFNIVSQLKKYADFVLEYESEE